MEAIKKLNEEAQLAIAEKFDKEYAVMQGLIVRAYEQGIKDGKGHAKKEIIDMIKWEEDQ